ncbi:MAG: hypothetical protein EYC62_02000 [Alphaproteobacteria bacterium]|nr:MAG: hypothetical protein EYC62_02000 [Alphaproteobacteria bacterium]
MVNNPVRPIKALVDLSSSQIETLKIMAILFMVIDHMNRIMFHTEQFWMIAVGRIAFPLFCFIAAYHYEKPIKNFKKYIFLLITFGVISQPIYIWTLAFTQFNIFFTLAAGLVTVWLYDNQDRFLSGLNKAQRMAAGLAAAVVWFLAGFYVDYSHAGILLIPCMVLWLRYQTDLFLFCAFATVIIANYFVAYSIVGLLAFALIFVVALIPSSIPRLPRYFYYLFYPAHLVILKLVALYLLQQ